MQEFDEVISERAKRACPPDSYVVNGSTPVLSFGDPSKSRIATIGINPSCDEFEELEGKLFSEAKRRLEDFHSLAIESSTEITDQMAERIHAGCLNYFNRRPYGWFNQLNLRVNQLFECTYSNGSAVHLDLVQWATNPVWGGIKSQKVQQELLDSDSDFLRHQLNSARQLELVYLSGDQVFTQLQNTGIFEGVVAESHSFVSTNGKKSSYYFYAGKTFNGIPACGWSRVMPGHYIPSASMDLVFGNLSRFIREFSKV